MMVGLIVAFIVLFITGKPYACKYFVTVCVVITLVYTIFFILLMSKMSKLHRYEYETNRKSMFMFWIFTTVVVSFESYFFAMTDVSQIGNKDAENMMESFIYIMWYNCAELE